VLFPSHHIAPDCDYYIHVLVAIGRRAVVFLTEIRAEAAMQAQIQVAVGGRMESEVEVAQD